MKRHITCHLSLIAVLFMASCFGGGGFASTLSGLLTASPAFFDSLNLGDKRAAVVQDFTDLANDATALGTGLEACAKDNACKVNAIAHFETQFWDVERRGHFKLSPKLVRVQAAVDGVIAAAKIYYGGVNKNASRSAGSPASDGSSNEASLKSAVEELKAAVKP